MYTNVNEKKRIRTGRNIANFIWFVCYMQTLVYQIARATNEYMKPYNFQNDVCAINEYDFSQISMTFTIKNQ